MNDIIVKIGADVTDFSRKLADSNKSLADFGKANAETFDAFKKTGAAVTGFGVAIAAGLGSSVKVAADFESAMSEVQAISGATGSDFDNLRSKAIEMGNSTMFSASASAEAMGNLAQMGWETDQIIGGIEHTLNLAAAGGLELADSALLMANTMNQFGLETEEAERVADVFALTASSAGTDVMEMGDALRYAGAGASAAGLDIEQTAAFIGVLGDAGITGSKAGTALNAMLRDLKASAEDGAVAVGDQTVALYDADGQMRNMPDVISEVIKATETMNQEQRDAALASLFGEQALQGFNAIASQGADAVSGLAGELYESEGAAKDMAEIMQDNLNGALTELSSAFEGIQIALGSALIPAIKTVAEWLTKLADWFNGLSDSTKSAIAIFAGISSVLMIVGGALLLLIGFIPQIVAGFAMVVKVVAFLAKGIAILANPIVWIGVAVAALAYLIYRYWDEIKEYTTIAWTAIKDFFVGVWEWITDIFQGALDWLEGLTEGKFGAYFSLIQGYMEMAWGIIQDVWEYIKDSFKNALNFLKGLVTLDFSLMKKAISDQLENARRIISSIWNRIKDFFGTILNSIWSTVVQKFTDIVNSAREKMAEAKAWVESTWNQAVEFLRGIDLVQIGRDIIQGLINGIKSMGVWVKEAISDLSGWIPNWIKEKLGIASPSRVLMEIGRWTVEGLADGITDSVGMVSKSTDLMTQAAIPDRKEIDLTYATPSGIRTSLASAVSGTVDVNARDDRLISAIGSLERRLGNLEVVMDGEQVGRIVRPHVNNGNALDATVGRYFD